jgi:threonyl-tRNA synthetase
MGLCISAIIQQIQPPTHNLNMRSPALTVLRRSITFPRIIIRRQSHSQVQFLRSNSSSANLPSDHRTLAAAQDLLITHPTSPGSPLFLPHGARIFNKLLAFVRSQYALYGYDEVITPTIYKKSLWETSGHWENYKEHMFEVAGRGEKGVIDEGTQDQLDEYGLKPMNCPGHCLLFKHASGKLSLRDLPVRYADFAPLHRYALPILTTKKALQGELNTSRRERS